jgi:hypothetical protein
MFADPTQSRKRYSDEQSPPLRKKSVLSKKLVSIANVRNLSRLAECPLTARVKFSEARKCVVYTDPEGRAVTCKGLLNQLTSTFYPQYDFFEAGNIHARHHRGESRIGDAAAEQSTAMGRLIQMEKKQRGLKSRELGSFIDKEHTLLASLEYASDMKKHTIEQHVKQQGCSIYTELLLTNKRVWGWTTYATQFAIRDMESGVATMIDEICHDSEYNLIIVEHKYGYGGYRDQATAYMNEPLEHILNSPQNQHFLQIGWSKLVLEKYWGVTVHAAFVVYITDEKCEAVPLPDWFYSVDQLFWERYQTVMKRRLF